MPIILSGHKFVPEITQFAVIFILDFLLLVKYSHLMKYLYYSLDLINSENSFQTFQDYFIFLCIGLLVVHYCCLGHCWLTIRNLFLLQIDWLIFCLPFVDVWGIVHLAIIFYYHLQLSQIHFHDKKGVTSFLPVLFEKPHSF